MTLYEILILGSPKEWQISAINKNIMEVAAGFELDFPGDIKIRLASEAGGGDPKAATVALYFGGDPSVDSDLVDELEAAKIPIVPVVRDGDAIESVVPGEITSTNACILDKADKSLEALTAVTLEMLGLLHRQRRIFISYRRSESRETAIQLHDELSAKGFDVFLDTHDIRPVEPFQEVLWHRLADCDVTIMLDTPDYFNSKWTVQEIGRSQALGIQILRVVWPAHSGSRHLSLSETIALSAKDLDRHQRLRSEMVTKIAKRAEALRSRSITTRHLDLVGRIKSEITRIGGQFEGIGSFRSISLTLPNGQKIEAYPMVGVPTAEMMNDIQVKANKAGHGRFPCLVYNHIGIRPAWLDHLKWLDTNISTVRTLKAAEAGWELMGWCR